MTGAQSLVRSLEELGCEVVFGIPGGAILPAYDPLCDSTKVRHVLVRHEQGAGHAATGYAQATGKVGVCMATSGPGATNLVTPIADAHMDSVPMVAITGQVAPAADRHRRLPGGRHLRHHHADHQAQLPGAPTPRTSRGSIAEAFHLASHRPTRARCWSTSPRTCCRRRPPSPGRRRCDLPGYRPTTQPHGKQIREAARLIAAAPGGRCSTSAAACSRPRPPTELLRAGRADRHPGGHHADGARRVPGQPPAAPGHARHARHGRRGRARCRRRDLLIALGARFDDRVTGKLDSLRARTRKVIHADIDPAEIGKNRHADVPIVGDCQEVIAELIERRRGRARRHGHRPTWPTGGRSSTTCAATLPAGLRPAGRRHARPRST